MEIVEIFRVRDFRFFMCVPFFFSSSKSDFFWQGRENSTVFTSKAKRRSAIRFKTIVEENELIVVLKWIRILQNKVIFLGFIDLMDAVGWELKYSVTRNNEYFAARYSTSTTSVVQLVRLILTYLSCHCSCSLCLVVKRPSNRHIWYIYAGRLLWSNDVTPFRNQSVWMESKLSHLVCERDA